MYRILDKKTENKRILYYICSDNKTRTKEEVAKDIENREVTNARMQVYNGTLIIRVKEKDIKRVEHKGNKGFKSKNKLTKEELEYINKIYKEKEVIDKKKLDAEHILVHYRELINYKDEHTDVVNINKNIRTIVANSMPDVNNEKLINLVMHRYRSGVNKIGLNVNWVEYTLKSDRVRSNSIYNGISNDCMENEVAIDLESRVAAIITIDNVKRAWIELIVVNEQGLVIARNNKWQNDVIRIRKFKGKEDFKVISMKKVGKEIEIEIKISGEEHKTTLH